MSRRFYHPPPLASGRRLELDRERAHYLTRVLRLRRGETVECFDGRGSAWEATLTDATARSAVLLLGDRIAHEPEPEPLVHLLSGLLKGAAMDMVVQKAVELGATDLWPLKAERSNVSADDERAARKRGHWARVIESAAEQCGALHLTRLHPTVTLDAVLANPPAPLLLLDPGAPPLPLSLPRAPVGLLIGPEGGWSAAERQRCEAAGVPRFGLGRRVLRAETAPLAALAAVRHGWGWPS